MRIAVVTGMNITGRGVAQAPVTESPVALPVSFPKIPSGLGLALWGRIVA
jgi:hypothetical protein